MNWVLTPVWMSVTRIHCKNHEASICAGKGIGVGKGVGKGVEEGVGGGVGVDVGVGGGVSK